MKDNTTEIIRSLGRLEGKCDSIIASLKDHTGRMNRIDEDVEDVRSDISELKKEVAKLDKKQYAIITVATLLWGILLVAARKLL